MKLEEETEKGIPTKDPSQSPSCNSHQQSPTTIKRKFQRALATTEQVNQLTNNTNSTNHSNSSMVSLAEQANQGQ
jgi:hypothetical protein